MKEPVMGVMRLGYVHCGHRPGRSQAPLRVHAGSDARPRGARPGVLQGLGRVGPPLAWSSRRAASVWSRWATRWPGTTTWRSTRSGPQQFGCIVERMSAGENPEVGDGVRIILPSEHVLELYHDMTLVGTEVGSRQPGGLPAAPAGRRRAAHRPPAAVTRPTSTSMDRFFHEVLDFYAVERVQTSAGGRRRLHRHLDVHRDAPARHRVHRRPAGQAAPLRVRAEGLVGDPARRPALLDGRRAGRHRARPSTASPAARRSTSSTRRATATRSSPAATRRTPTGPPSSGRRTSWARASSTSTASSTSGSPPSSPDIHPHPFG